MLKINVVEPDLVSPQWKQNVVDAVRVGKKKKKCVFIRRADQVSGSMCRGWKTFLRKILEKTAVPIVMTAWQKPFESYSKLCVLALVRSPSPREIATILRSVVPHAPRSLVRDVSQKASGSVSYAIGQVQFFGKGDASSPLDDVLPTRDQRSGTIFQELDRLILCKGRGPTVADACKEVYASPSGEFLLGEHFHQGLFSVPTSSDLDTLCVLTETLSQGDCMNSVLRKTMDFESLGAITTAVSFGVPATIARCHPDHPPPNCRTSRREIASAHRRTHWGRPVGLNYVSTMAKKRRLKRMFSPTVQMGEYISGGHETLEFALQVALQEGIGCHPILNRFLSFEDLENALYVTGLTKKWKSIPLRTRKAIMATYDTEPVKNPKVRKRRSRASAKGNPKPPKRRKISRRSSD